MPTFRQSGLPNFRLFPIQTVYLNQNPIWMSAFGLNAKVENQPSRDIRKSPE
jgi:hypothetical protein